MEASKPLSFSAWRQASFPMRDVERVLQNWRHLTPKELCFAAITHMQAARQRGEVPQAASYLERYAPLRDNEHYFGDLLYVQYLAENQLNPGLQLGDFCQRFPGHRRELELHDYFGRLFGRESLDLGEFGCIRIKQFLGRGTFGIVYLAEQDGVDRLVAVKVLDPIHNRDQDPDSDQEALRRFDREARIIGSLDHPNVVKIYFAKVWKNHRLQVMEYIEGGSLRDLLSRGPQDPIQAARLILQAADGMAAAHRAPGGAICHRDLKPENILLTATDVLKLVDFGIASGERFAGTKGTATGMILGTPGYQAPEICRGEVRPAQPQSDVYSLGVILFELVTGNLPLGSRSDPPSIKDVQDKRPLALRQVRPDAPWQLEQICNRCLMKEPRRRFADAAELAQELRNFLEGHPVRGARRPSPWSDRHPRSAQLLRVVVSLALLALVAGSWSWWRLEDENRFSREVSHTLAQLTDQDFVTQGGRKAIAQIDAQLGRLRALAGRDAARQDEVQDVVGRVVNNLFAKWHARYLGAARPTEEERQDALAVLDWLARFDEKGAADARRLLPAPTAWPIQAWNSEQDKFVFDEHHEVRYLVAAFDSPADREGLTVNVTADLPPPGRDLSVHVDGDQPNGVKGQIVDDDGTLTVPLQTGEVARVNLDGGGEYYRMGRPGQKIVGLEPAAESGLLVAYADGVLEHQQGGGASFLLLDQDSGLAACAVSPSRKWLALFAEHSQGRTVYVAETPVASRLVRDFDLRQQARQYPLPHNPRDLAIDDQGTPWVIDSQGTLLQGDQPDVWRPVNLAPVESYQLALGWEGWVASAVVVAGRHEVHLWRSHDPESRQQFPCDSQVTALDVARQEPLAAWGDASGGTWIARRQARGWSVERLPQSHSHPVTGVQFDETAERLVSTSANGDCQVWIVGQGSLRTTVDHGGRTGISVRLVQLAPSVFRLDILNQGRLVSQAEFRSDASQVRIELRREGPRLRLFVDRQQCFDGVVFERFAARPNLLLVMPSSLKTPTVSVQMRCNPAAESFSAADLLYSQGDYESARKAYEQIRMQALASGDQGSQLEALLGLAWCCDRLGQTTEAIDALAQLPRKSPAEPLLWSQRRAMCETFRWYLLSNDLTDPQRRMQADLQRESIARQFYFGGPERSGQVDVSQVVPVWLRLGLIQNYRRVTSPLIALLALDPGHLGQVNERVEMAELLNVETYELLGSYIDLAEAAWFAAAEDPSAGALLASTMEKIRQHYRQVANPLHVRGNERLVEEAMVRLSWYDRTRGNDARRSRKMIEEIELASPEFSRQWQPLVLERARICYALGDTDGCRHTLEQLVAEHGNLRELEFGYWAQAHMMLGFLALDAGDRQQAVSHWRHGQYAAWSSFGPKSAPALREHPAIPQVNQVFLALLAEDATLAQLAVALRDTRALDLIPPQFRFVVASLLASPKEELLQKNEELTAAVILGARTKLPAESVQRVLRLLSLSDSPVWQDAVRDYAFRTKEFSAIYRQPLASLGAEAVKQDLKQSCQVELSKQELLLIEEITAEVVGNSQWLVNFQGRQDIESLVRLWFGAPASANLQRALTVFDPDPRLKARVLYLFALAADQPEPLLADIQGIQASAQDQLLRQCLRSRFPAEQPVRQPEPQASSPLTAASTVP